MASIFTQIINGDLPGHFVWKDDNVVAFMTIQPIRPGHVLVIPREEIDHWDDLPPPLAGRIMLVSQKIAKAIKVAFPSERVGMTIVGLEVPHTHLHVLPIDNVTDIDFSKAQMAEADDLAQAAEQIRSVLANQGNPEAFI